jgi:hypothetical protein
MICLIRIWWCAIVLLLVVTASQAQQEPGAALPTGAVYPESSEGLQKLLQDITEAAKAKDTAKETVLIRSLIMPDDTWFKDEFGPAFGPRLAAAYQKALSSLEEEMRTAYEGDAQRGWLSPQIFRYDDAANVNSPTDNFLNCMDKVVPLYQSAFSGGRTGYLVGPSDSPGKMKVIAGDLPGYYVYAETGFRYVPQNVFFLLPKERPLRIQLDMNVMRSKVINYVQWKFPVDVLLKQHVFGKVVIHLVVDVNGHIKEIKPVEGPPILSDSVLQAVRQWSFEPTTLDGEPVEVQLNLETGFMRQN